MTSQFMLPNFGGELPLGYIFEFDPTGITGAPDLSTAEKVHDYFGYGVWEDYGSGRVTIGVSNTHAISTEGGEENHTLSEPEMPSHAHSVAVNGDTRYPLIANSEYSSTMVTGQSIGTVVDNSIRFKGYHVFAANAGNSQPHNNMQPYKTVYRWRRIA